MSDRLVTERELEGLLRRLAALEQRVALSAVIERSEYAFGTYTPTYTGSTTAGVTTYTTQQGAWIRIGKKITVTGTIVWTAATGTGNAQISLPVASANVANQNYSGSVRNVNVTFANSTPQLVLSPNASVFILQSPLTNAASTTVAMEAAGNIVFTIVYFVD